ncbi:MAG: DUF4416 family protein [Candidatus Omnitrophica bacterium]|nr:DUF4416 family protein [Candidatus Omnitrophota bacterium]
MGTPKKAPPVKRFCGIIYQEENLYQQARLKLISHWGQLDAQAGPWPFSFTKYYESEMGQNLKRCFFSFKQPVFPEECFAWKLLTNQLEQELSFPDGRRRVNLDPGYLELSRVVLLTTKNFSHRIYLGEGIYAEVTLLFRQGEFIPLPWTYPDYRTCAYLDFFRHIRELYWQGLRDDEKG